MERWGHETWEVAGGCTRLLLVLSPVYDAITSVDDRGRSWRLKFERKRRERPPIVEDMTNHREGRCNSDTIVTDMLTRRFLFALYDSHLQRLISWKFLFVVSEKLIEKFIS